MRRVGRGTIFAVLVLTFATYGAATQAGAETADEDPYAPRPTDYVAVQDSAPDRLLSLRYDESGPSGPLRQKAEEYDALIEEWHLPDYGSHVHVEYTDATQTAVRSYEGHGDSCIWTGTYLNSQALRYHVTGDPAAKENAAPQSALPPKVIPSHSDVTKKESTIHTKKKETM